MRRRPVGSISLPIVLASVSVAMAVAVLFGWVLLIVRHAAVTRQMAQNTWLLIAGIVSLATIITVLVMFTVFLVRQIVEARRQTSFIDSVTHELKSPLASLRLCLDTLRRSDLHDDQRTSLQEMMTDSVDRLGLFIDDVLEASLLTHGRGGMPVGEVAIRPLLDRCIASVVMRYRVPAEAIHVDVAPDLALETDATALETVLRNLLDNAVKYSTPPVHVEVTARDGGRVEIAVRDRGIGLSRRHLKRIFERFYRVESEDVRSRPGTGLGLFVVSALVRNLGGRIMAHSDGPGHGSVFTVSLPRGAR